MAEIYCFWLKYISLFTLKEEHGHGDGHYHGDGHGHDEVSFVKAVYLILNIEEELNCLYEETYCLLAELYNLFVKL